MINNNRVDIIHQTSTCCAKMSVMSDLPFKRVNDNAIIPTKGSASAAGYDLTSVQNIDIKPGEWACVDTGIQVAIPDGFYGRVAPRSGLAVRNGIDVGGGVIDSDYRGNIGVILFNFGKEVFRVTIHMKIAQIIFTPCGNYFTLTEVDSLPGTERGKDGFGSTGNTIQSSGISNSAIRTTTALTPLFQL